MLSPVTLLALLILPSAWAGTVEERIEELDTELLGRHIDQLELLEILGRELQSIINATSQLQIELDTLRGRQAASAAVQASQVLMLVVYFLTILSIYVVKRHQKVREKAQQKDFELLEKQLRSSRAKRRAAAAKEKSAPAASQE